jgi:plastocyanin
LDVQRAVWSAVVLLFVAMAVSAVAVLARENVGAEETSPAAAAAGPAVTMADLQYEPKTLTVARGSEVLFENKDTAPHTITADDNSVDTGLINPGKSATLTVNEAFAYFCQLHPSMKGEIRLEG